MKKIETFDLSYFLKKVYVLVTLYQQTFSKLVLKEVKGSEYATALKSKELIKTKLYSLQNASLLNVKRFGYKIGIQFKNSFLI